MKKEVAQLITGLMRDSGYLLSELTKSMSPKEIMMFKVRFKEASNVMKVEVTSGEGEYRGCSVGIRQEELHPTLLEAMKIGCPDLPMNDMSGHSLDTEVERRKCEGGVLWFIESKQTHKWLSKADVTEFWTSNPQDAIAFLTELDASIANVYTRDHDVYLTEHEFMTLPEKKKEKNILESNVKSSNVAKVKYHIKERLLDVVFLNGGVYRYKNVDKKIYDGFLTAESVGKYLRSCGLLSDYEFEKLEK